MPVSRHDRGAVSSARSLGNPVQAAESRTLRMSIGRATLVLVGSVTIALSGHAQNVGNWSMSGRVVDAATGRPIAGARVAATADSRPGSAYLGYSDPDGGYHFDRMVSGTYVVYVTVTHRT